jgi:sigma-B regulation protein RsbU (phosphoserine phosphatase)
MTVLLFIIMFLALGFTIRFALKRDAALKQSQMQHRELVNFLGLFIRSLSRVSEIDRTMKLVAHYVGDVLGAESAAIYHVVTDPHDGQQKLQLAGAAGIFPPIHRVGSGENVQIGGFEADYRQELISFGEGPIGKVAQTWETILIDNAEVKKPFGRWPKDVRTLMAVPMQVENRLVGVVCAVNSRQAGRAYGLEDLKMLETLSYQVALAGRFVSIYTERSEQQRIFQELELARQIQRSLLPSEVPAPEEYEIHADSRSAQEVGGDFYDFVTIDDDRLMVIVADASGKGVPACMLMAMCRSFIHAAVEPFVSLEEFLLQLNKFLYRDTDDAHFVTLGICVINHRLNTCEYARAGHTELLMRNDESVCREIFPDGPAVGLLPHELGLTFAIERFEIPPATTLMMFTDGITEAHDARGEEFGVQRLCQLMDGNQMRPRELGETVLSRVREFAGDSAQEDDQTVVVISRTVHGVARAGAGGEMVDATRA